jgi:hypothetical protein
MSSGLRCKRRLSPKRSNRKCQDLLAVGKWPLPQLYFNVRHQTAQACKLRRSLVFRPTLPVSRPFSSSSVAPWYNSDLPSQAFAPLRLVPPGRPPHSQVSGTAKLETTSSSTTISRQSERCNPAGYVTRVQTSCGWLVPASTCLEGDVSLGWHVWECSPHSPTWLVLAAPLVSLAQGRVARA